MVLSSSLKPNEFRIQASFCSSVKELACFLVSFSIGFLASAASVADPEGRLTDVQGLPISGQVGVHALGDYSDPHAIQRSKSSAANLQLEIPPGRYVALRFLVSGANGESLLPVRLRFLDGTTHDDLVPAPDWFDDPEPNNAAATPILNRLDRALGERISDRDDPALFEVIIPVSNPSPLIGLDLRFSDAQFPVPESRIHCFAITGVRALQSEF